ncbi:MAG: hypothetical protein DCC71_25740, partial [Proteobacteria bacterium]
RAGRAGRSAGRAARAALALLLVLGSLAFVFALGEGVLRLLYGGAPPYFFSRIVEHDAQRGWRLVPGDYEFFNVAAFTRVRASISEYGIRSTAAPIVAPPRRRLTVIGDSFVFAEALSDGERFTDALQALVGPDVEVVNAGVPGYGTGQQVLLVEDLRARGFALGSALIHAFFTNDILDNAGLDYDSLDPDPKKPVFEVRDGALVSTAVAPGPPIPTAAISAQMARRSLFAALLRQRVEVLVASHPGILRGLGGVGVRVPLPRPPGVILGWYAPGWEERWSRTRDVLRQFAQTARAGGADFAIAFIPSPFQAEAVFEELLRAHRDEPLYAAFLDDVDRPQRVLLEFCAVEGLSCFDTTPALRAPRDEPAYFLHEGHLSAYGSRIVADAFHDEILARGLPR